MKTLQVKAVYGQLFTHEKLPRLYLQLIRSELKKPECFPLLRYIQQEYNISYIQLSKLITKNIRISMYADTVVIGIDPNVQIDETLKLETLLKIINDGTISLRGSNSINKITQYLMNNIDSLYRISKHTKGSKLWQ